MDPKPKAQALTALAEARKLVASPETLLGARLAILRGLLEYAEEQVEAISETKRPRTKKETTP